MTVDTAIMFEAIVVLSILAIVMIGRLMWKSGGEFIPETMKVLFHATRDWFSRMGWGPDTHARRPLDDYPNRKENS